MLNTGNAKIYGDFYSPEHLLSYGRPFSISVGTRSIGKTTGIGIHLIRYFLRTGQGFIYLRRTEDELDKTAPSAFDNALFICKKNGLIVDLFYKRGFYYVQVDETAEPVLCGCALALSTEDKHKSQNFSSYDWIWYEEFICLDSTRYLGTKDQPIKEYEKLMELYQTVDRGVGQAFKNTTRIICTGNNLSYFNPIYRALGITSYIRTDSKMIAPKGKLWVLEQTSTVKATSKIKESYAYQMSPDSMQESAYDNFASGSKETFVETFTGPKRFLYNVRINGNTYGVYKTDQLAYVCNDSRCGMTIALTNGDLSIDSYMLATRPGDSELVKFLKTMYGQGRVRFQTATIRYDILNFFLLTP